VSARNTTHVEDDMAAPGAKTTAQRPVCLVLMPMYVGFEEIRACVGRALEGADMEMWRLEEEIADSAWHVWLLDSAETPDMVLVDLTHHNPFVMYELGYVHYRRLPTLFIIDASEQRLPATVRGAVCTVYGDCCEHFESDLTEHLRLLRRARPNITEGGHDRPLTATVEPYRMAISAADDLDAAIGRRLSRVDESEFRRRLDVSRRRGAPDPTCLTGRAQARYLITLLLEESDRVEIIQAICAWSFGRLPVSCIGD
jgi:hypothetical protein